jgi:phosphate transport system substrate-binding protein
MRSKPPIRRNRATGWLGRRAKLRGLALLGTATLSLTAVSLTSAGPALADPTTTYVAVGSDTTQNVLDGIANASFGNALVGSWDSVNPVTQTIGEIITPAKISSGGTQTNCSFTRPNGSGQGLIALRESINPSTTAGPPNLGVEQGCVDIGRSSSAPPAANLNPAGQLVWVPFALDGVATATGGTTNITTADMFTFADLQTLYANCGTVTEGGVTYNPGTATTGQQQIDLYIPQSGSGTRNFWASTLGFSNTSPPACVHDHIVPGVPNAGAVVEEHDGTAYQSDPNGFGPFSIAQWIAQRNGVQLDRRHGAVLHNINAVSPFSNGNPATGTLNTNYPITREVFNIVAYDRVVNTGDGNFDPVLSGLLAGTTSRLCSQSFTIRNFGFATLSASTPDLCGSTANSLRAFVAGTI